MPRVICKKCEKESFYRNVDGRDIKAKCVECGIEIDVPFKTARSEDQEDYECKKCGHVNKILHILPKKTMYTQTGYRGGSVKMYHGTREQIQKGICEKCGEELE